MPWTALFSRTVTRPAAPSTRSRVAGGSGSGVGGMAVLAVLASLAAIALHTSAATWGLPSAQDAPVDLAVGLAYPLIGALVVVHGRGSRDRLAAARQPASPRRCGADHGRGARRRRGHGGRAPWRS